MGDQLLGQPGGHFALDKKKDRAHHPCHHQQNIEVHGPGGVRQREIVHAQLPQQQERPRAAQRDPRTVLLHRQHQNIKQDEQDQRQCHFVSSAGSSGLASSSIIR